MKYLFIIFFVFGLCIYEVSAEEEISSDFDMKIRGGFMSVLDMDLLEDMSRNGLNTALVKYKHMQWPFSNEQKKEIRNWAESCKSAKLMFLPTLNFWSTGEVEWIKPKFHYVFGGREFPNSPCPLESRTYELSVHNRCLEFARLSLSLPIMGIVFNTELFASEFNLFTEACYCDNCWELFCRDHPELRSLKIGQRQKYLNEKGKTKLYNDFFVERLFLMSQKTRREIDKINRSFIVGFGGLDKPTYFHEGLKKGFGSGDTPVYIFSRDTYKTGYNNYIGKTIRKLKNENINAKFIVGLWQDQFPVERLPEQYYHCAKNSDGYWIYTIQSLNPNWKSPLVDSRKNYWRAMQKANEELEKLSRDQNYKTHLKVQSFDPPLHPIDYKQVRTETLQYVYPSVPFENQSVPLLIRNRNKLVFNAKKGDLIRYRVKFDERLFRNSAVKYAEVKLITNRGELLAEDRVTRKHIGVVEITAPYTGSFCVLLNSDSGTNLQVVGFTHPYSIDASRWPNLYVVWPVSELYFYKLPDGKAPKVSISVHSTSESVKAVFETDSGQLIGQYDIKGKQTILLPLKNNFKEEVIKLSFPKLSWRNNPHLVITVQAGLGKYISQHKAGLVKYISN